MRIQDCLRLPWCLAILVLPVMSSPVSAADRQVKPFVWSQNSTEAPQQAPNQAPPPDFATTLSAVEDAQKIPDDVVMWSFFGFLHAAEAQQTDEARSILERAIKLDSSAAAIVQTYVSGAIRVDKEFQSQARVNQCAKLRGTHPIADDEFAADLDASEEASRLLHKEKVSRLAGLLDTESNVKLQEWVNANFRPGFHMVVFDFKKFLASPGVTRPLVMQRLCGAESSN